MWQRANEALTLHRALNIAVVCASNLADAECGVKAPGWYGCGRYTVLSG
jgi:hypothetical protein